MAKALKVVAWVVGGLVALVVAVAIVAPLVVDPNDYRDEIGALVEKQTGRTLAIEGELDLSVFPWLGLEVGAVELGNAKGFGPEPFARVERADIHVKLLPLLRKEVEVDTIALHGLAVNLARAADGTTNWADLAAGKAAPAGKPAAGAPPGGAAAALAVGGLEIRDAHLVWDDRAAGQRYTIEGLALESGAVRPGAPFPLELAFGFTSKAPAATGRLEFEGEVTVDLETKRYRLAGAQLSLSASGDGVPGGGVEGTLGLEELTADLAAQTAQLSGLRLATAGTELTGEAAVQRLLGEPAAKGSLRVSVEDAAALAGLLPPGLPEGFRPEALEGSRLETAFEADLKAQTAKVGPLEAELAGVGLSGRADLRKLRTAPEAGGHLETTEFSPRALLERLGLAVPEMQDGDALGRARLAVDFQETSAARVALPTLRVELDETTVSGNLTAREFSRPVLRYDLKVDTLDLDRYLPPPAEESAPATPGRAATGAAALPMEPLRSLDVAGDLRVGRLKAAKLRMADLHARLEGRGGQLRLHPLTAKLYEGSYAGDVRLDARGEAPVTRLNETLQGVQVEPLLDDLTGKARISGTTELSARLAARGADPDAVRRSLDGTVAFHFRDGAVVGVNIAQLLRKAYAAAKGQPAPPEVPAKTDFSELQGTLRFSDGKVRNDDLSAKSPLFRITGEGSADLVKEEVDYLVRTAVVGTIEGQGGKELGDLKGLTIPLRVTGPFADPSFRVDLEGLLGAKARQAIEEKKEAVKEKAEQAIEEKKGELKDEMDKKMEDKLKEGLKGLFK